MRLFGNITGIVVIHFMIVPDKRPWPLHELPASRDLVYITREPVDSPVVCKVLLLGDVLLGTPATLIDVVTCVNHKIRIFTLVLIEGKILARNVGNSPGQFSFDLVLP